MRFRISSLQDSGPSAILPVVWGSICVYLALFITAAISFGYVILSAVNLTYFSATGQFRLVRFFQLLMSLVLPFPFQWSLGGFVPSGAVMLWAMAAVLGAFTFQETGLTVRWFLAYLVLTIASSILEGGRIDQLDNSEQVKRCRDLLQTTHVGTVESSAPITGLVDNLRRFAKLDDAPRQNVDLHEGIDSAPASADLAPSGERRTTPIGGASGSR